MLISIKTKPIVLPNIIKFNYNAKTHPKNHKSSRKSGLRITKSKLSMYSLISRALTTSKASYRILFFIYEPIYLEKAKNQAPKGPGSLKL